MGFRCCLCHSASMDNMILEKQTSNLKALQQHNQGMIKIKILK